MQAILFNYLTCGILGNLLSGSDAVILTDFWNRGWFPYTLLIGVFFISIFFAIGETAQKLGVSVSMVAAKLSVVIPILFAVIWYDETLGFVQIAGILISLTAVYLISRKEGHAEKHGKLAYVLPLVVFLGSGVIDTSFNYITKNWNADNADSHFGAYTVTTAFSFAFVIGTLVMVYLLATGKQTLQVKNILWGIALGLPNYFSMFFLVKTLSHFSSGSAIIFPINNIGIVALSALVSVYFFAEKMSKQNLAGLALAALAIILIAI